MKNETSSSLFYGTFMEAWPESLEALSFEHTAVELSLEDQRALISREPDGRALMTMVEPRPYSDALQNALLIALTKHSEGAFLRLGSCSFVMPHRRPMKIQKLAEAMTLLENPGARAAKMVYRCLVSRHPVALYLRQWHDILPESEFRLFIREGVIVGVSQYHHALIFPELAAKAKAIVEEIGRFKRELLPRLPMPSVVADICMFQSQKPWQTYLIEINPFMHATGAALFDWDQSNDFDGTLRILDRDGGVARIPLDTLDS